MRMPVAARISGMVVSLKRNGREHLFGDHNASVANPQTDTCARHRAGCRVPSVRVQPRLGIADLLLVLSGEGTISISLPSVEKKSPDEKPEVGVEPEGELELSGSIEGRASCRERG